MSKPLEGEALILAAAKLAERLHEGQEHRFGDDSYFNLHLRPIAGIIQRLGYGALYVATGYLHDALEDTSATTDELLAEGIPVEVVHATDLLAKRGEPHHVYLAGILTDKFATVGKFGDSSYNLSWSILNSPDVSDAKFSQRVLEYSYNLSVLRPHLPKPE